MATTEERVGEGEAGAPSSTGWQKYLDDLAVKISCDDKTDWLAKKISMILRSRSLVKTKQHYLEDLSCEGGEVGLGRGACWERGGRL